MKGRVSCWPKGRGGARKGAGRPARDFWTTLKIGQAAETMWRAEAKAALDKRVATLLGNVRAAQDRTKLVPQPYRAAWRGGDAHEDIVDDIDAEMHRIHGTNANEVPASRFISIVPPQPYGVRARIIRELAAAFDVPESTVKRCWTEYRKFERDLATDEKSAEI